MSESRAKYLRRQVRLSMEANHADMRLFKNTYRKIKKLWTRSRL